MKSGTLLWSLLLCMSPLAWAGEEHAAAHAPAPSSETSADVAAYEQLKALAGLWKGQIEEPASGGPIEIRYEIASGGKAVLERMFAGTEHEMLTVYFLASDRLHATHYCSIGNQPSYRLGSFRDGTLAFEFAGGTGFDPKTDEHARGTTLKLLAPDRLESSWLFHKGEQPSGTARSVLTRSQRG